MPRPWIWILLAILTAVSSCRRGEPNPPLHLEVVGENYEWYIRYPGADLTLQTPDDVVVKQHVHVPASTELTISLTSKDYIYTFRVPELNQKQMAVPDIVFTLAFDTGEPGHYLLKGDQMCSFSHESLIGNFVVEPRKVFDVWLAGRHGRAGDSQ